MPFILFLTLLLAFPALAANRSVGDSLVRSALDSSLLVASKMQVLNSLFSKFLEKDPRLALSYSRQSLRFAQKLADSLAIATARNHAGDALRVQGKLEEALHEYFEALRIINRQRPSVEKANALGGIGLILQAQGNYSKALFYFLNALTLAKESGHARITAEAQHRVGRAYAYQRRFDQALEYYTQSLKLRKKLNDRAEIANSYNDIGFVYQQKGKYPKALNYYQRALIEMRQADPDDKVDLPAVFNNIGDVCFLQKQYPKALAYYQQSLEQARKFGSKGRLREVYADLAETYFKLGDYPQTFLYQKLHATLQDSLHQIQNNGRITEIEAKYATQEKEKQIELLKKEKELDSLRKQAQIQQLHLRERKLINVLLIVGLVLAASVAAFLYRRYRDRQETSRLLEKQYETIQSQNEELQITNEKLKESEEYLLQLNATKDKFFSIISHDLKSPLNSLTGFLQVLDLQVDAFSPHELRVFAKDMNKSVKSLLELLDNLLHWSRAQTGTIEYAPQALNVSEVVENNLNLLRANAQSKGIELSAQVDSGLQVYADRNMLNSVLRNLISNAIKFTNPGGYTIVEALNTGQAVEMSVRDNGIGMNEETLNRLFRLDSYHSTLGTAHEKGNGIGLILCKEFVEKNGGKIWVESKEGEGTTFFFTVPVYEEVPVNS